MKHKHKEYGELLFSKSQFQLITEVSIQENKENKCIAALAITKWSLL